MPTRDLFVLGDVNGGQPGLISGSNNPYHAAIPHSGPDWSPTSMVSEFLRRNRVLLLTPLFKLETASRMQQGCKEGTRQVSLELNCPWEHGPKSSGPLVTS